MIIGAWNKLEIGKQYRGIKDKDKNPLPDQPYIVIRKATWQEWYDNLEDGAAKREIDNSVYLKLESQKGNFYEISTD